MQDETRVKRLQMRAWRRGMREMDLLLGPFSDTRLAQLSAQEQALFEEMLETPDQTLYAWVCGQEDPEPRFAGLMKMLAAFHEIADSGPKTR